MHLKCTPNFTVGPTNRSAYPLLSNCNSTYCKKDYADFPHRNPVIQATSHAYCILSNYSRKSGILKMVPCFLDYNKSSLWKFQNLVWFRNIQNQPSTSLLDTLLHLRCTNATGVHLGAMAQTCFNNWLLATPGSPIINVWMSPRIFKPSWLERCRLLGTMASQLDDFNLTEM